MARRNVLVLLALLMAALMLSGCLGGGVIGPDPENASVQGYILYDFDNDDIWIRTTSANPDPTVWERLDGAEISLFRNNNKLAETTTTANGFFAFTGLPAGDYEIDIREPSAGYFINSPKTISFRLNRSQNLNLQHVTRVHYLIVGPSGFAIDAGAVYDVITDNAMNVGETKKLTGSAATRSGILSEINRIGNLAHPEDDFVFYFSGTARGGPDALYDYIVPQGGHVNDPATTISDVELENAISSHFKRATVIIDGSYSGSFADGITRPKPQSLREQAFKAYYYTVLVAARADEEATTFTSGLGVFTHFLVQGLDTRDADLNNNGTILSFELYQYVYDEMENYFDLFPNEAPEHFPVHEGTSTVILRY